MLHVTTRLGNIIVYKPIRTTEKNQLAQYPKQQPYLIKGVYVCVCVCGGGLLLLWEGGYGG